MRERGRPSQADAIRITTASSSRGDDIAGRQRRYLISMAIRTLCVIGAVAVGDGALRWGLIAGAVFLPYVAVVLANTSEHRREPAGLRTALPQHGELSGPDNPSAPRRAGNSANSARRPR